MQIDVGFGDIITPGSASITYPALLDSPAPERTSTTSGLSRVNTPSTASCSRGPLPPRSRNRGTGVGAAPVGFTRDFTEQSSTLAQWIVFQSSIPNAQCPNTLADVVTFLASFLLPVARACAASETFELRWTPGGPWATNP